MRGFPTREQVNKIKERYPIGTVIELTADMEDNYNPIPKGMQGEVIGIDDILSIFFEGRIQYELFYRLTYEMHR